MSRVESSLATPMQMPDGPDERKRAVKFSRDGLRSHCLHIGHAANTLGRTSHVILSAQLGTASAANAGMPIIFYDDH